MQPSALILVGVLTPTSGIIGSLVWPVLQRRYKWSNLKVLIILVILASLMPVYGCFGFLPILKGKGRFGGLTTQGELFGLAVFFGWYFCFFLIQLNSLDRPGFVYGAFQGYARAFYAELLPPGEEARWQVFYNIHRAKILIRRNRYGLFSITDKVSLNFLSPVT